MTTKTAVIRKLAVANMLIALMLTAYGVFSPEKTVSAQEQPEQTQEDQPSGIPGKIDTLTAEPATLSVILSWDAPAEEIKSYSVEYGVRAYGVYDQICSADECVDAIPGAIIRDLEQDTEYMFRITPSNAEGTGEPSNEVYLTITGPCSGMANQEFCGKQVITSPVLRFTSIPTSFDFTQVFFYSKETGPAPPPVEPGATMEPEPTPEIEATSEMEATPEPELLSVADYGKAAVLDPSVPGTGTFPPIDVSSTEQKVYNNGNPATQPALEDLLGVQDTRDSGGFEAQIQASGTFTNGTDTIPLTNLYVATNISSPVYSVPATDPAYSCPATDCGVIYGTSVTTRGIVAPEDSQGNSLGLPWAYGSDFDSGPIVLMDGGLPASQGRNGYVYQFINFYLNVPAYQPAGDYALILTYTLIDDTL